MLVLQERLAMLVLQVLQATQVLLALQEMLVLQEPQVTQVLQVLLAMLVLQEPQAMRVLLALRVMRERRVLLAMLVLQEKQVPLDPQVLQVLQVLQELQVPQVPQEKQDRQETPALQERSSTMAPLTRMSRRRPLHVSAITTLIQPTDTSTSERHNVYGVI